MGNRVSFGGIFPRGRSDQIIDEGKRHAWDNYGDRAFYRDTIFSVMYASRSHSASAVTISLTPSTKRLWRP